MRRFFCSSFLVVVLAAFAVATAGFGQVSNRAKRTAVRPHPAASAGSPSKAVPSVEGIDVAHLGAIEGAVAEAIGAKHLPGAVVLVGRHGKTIYHQAFGNRAVSPAVEAMTPDTVFDLASLTKVVATATSVMMLVEDGKVRLGDRVANYIPEFGRYGKRNVTVRQLLTHTSGLRPDLDLEAEFSSYGEAIRRATEEVLVARPGERFIYSDINFFLLGDIVARVSGMPLDRFARERIFEPLGMRDTTFNPPEALRGRIAPTQPCSPLGWPCNVPNATMLRGVVHDPTARRMGGVAGHAGLFSTAADLARFCRMLLQGGELDGRRILSPLAVARLTSPATPPGDRISRGLGWDIDSAYASNRGDLLPIGSFGHTGFTGTSLWIDPVTDTFVVFLSNRVHPDGKGDVTPLRSRVASIVAAAITDMPVTRLREQRFNGAEFAPGPAPARAVREPVLAGIDVLEAEGFARLRGKRVGLVTNHTGRTRRGDTTIDVLHRAPGVTLAALFSPEHGIRGILDENVPSSRDEKTGLPIYSLYGDTRRPTEEWLRGLDTVVIDLQDVGARFYTYITTMAYVMEEAAKRKMPVFVLDRPNPVNGAAIEGPVIDRAALGFTAYFPMPIRHGMTMGELARLFNAENKIGADLTVVALKNWTRDDWFDETGLRWVNPSPNMRNMNEAELYPGIGAIEGTNLSVGRGTDTPFEQVGAPWIDGMKLAEALNARNLPGIRFYPRTFTPTSSKYAGELCEGVFMLITGREALRPVRVGLEIASAIYKLHGAKFQIDAAEKLLGSREALVRIRAGDDPALIAAGWGQDEAHWRLLRARYLLYY